MDTRNMDFDKSLLHLKTIHIQALDENRSPLTNQYASGFIMREDNDLFLYTCWHVVTGFDMHHIEVGDQLPKRKYLNITLQNREDRN